MAAAATTPNPFSNTITYTADTCSGNDELEYCCLIPNVRIDTVSSLTIDIFSLNNQTHLLNTTSFTALDRENYFTAGTAVLLDIHDDFHGSWSLDGHYDIDVPNGVITEEMREKCRQMTVDFAVSQIYNSMMATGVHNVIYSNDDPNDRFSVTPTTTIEDMTEVSEENLYEPKSFSSTSSYNIYKTCLNRKTGKIKY